jgi:hypothetical protein
MSSLRITWKALVLEVVRSLPLTFALRDVYAKRDYFAKHYPDNRFIEAKIRQSLQILAHQGLIRFLGNGAYERIADQPVFSPFFDPAIGSEYVNKAQVARVSVETWAEHNLYCLSCTRDELIRLPNNEKVADFECADCEARYQLKAKNGRFGGKVQGAEYNTTLRAIKHGVMPDHVFVEYDPRLHVVVFASGLPGSLLTEDRIVPRARLKSSARRAGWQGCQIVIADLERVYIVVPAGVERSDVRQKWRQLERSVR